MSHSKHTIRETVTMWTSLHLFYHEDRDRLLCQAVAPLAGEILAEGLGDQLFFLRYSLGGPHVRLRVRHNVALGDTIGQRTKQRIGAFFQECPSTETANPDDIARDNAAILAFAPLEADETIYPDNHLAVIDFHPEAERYGGHGLLPHTFEMFDASSLAVLELLLEIDGTRRPNQMAHFLRFLFCQVVGTARDLAEIEQWTTYDGFFWPRIRSVVDTADRVFEKQGSLLADLIEAEFRAPSFPLVVAASHRLADAVATIDPSVRRRILASHLHMTANRLGVKNRDEIYLCRLMERAWAQAASRIEQNTTVENGGEATALRSQAIDRLSDFAGNR